MLERAAGIIASSPDYLASSEALKPHSEKCHVIPLAIEDPAPQGLPAAAPKSQKADLSVLAVGRLTYYKGFDVIIRAISKCPGVSLQLVGDGEERSTLEVLCADLGVAHRVSFLHHCDDDTLHSLYASCDLLCLPSIERTESFGIVLLEAMSRGLTCVVSEVPGSGMSWVVDGKNSGTLFPPGEPEALAKMLNRLNTERDILSALGRCNRARFEKVFSLPHCAQTVGNLYTDVLKI
jgi:rhamnosyl/mannosyltransferase